MCLRRVRPEHARSPRRCQAPTSRAPRPHAASASARLSWTSQRRSRTSSRASPTSRISSCVSCPICSPSARASTNEPRRETPYGVGRTVALIRWCFRSVRFRPTSSGTRSRRRRGGRSSVPSVRGEERVLEAGELLLPPDENGGERTWSHAPILSAWRRLGPPTASRERDHPATLSPKSRASPVCASAPALLVRGVGKEVFYGNRNRQVVQRQQGIRLHHP
jgi:hypothetical protein